MFRDVSETRPPAAGALWRALLLLALAGASVLVAACGGGPSADPAAAGEAADPPSGVIVAEAEPRPSFALTDTSGDRFDFATETAGFLTLLYFGYTNCPDVCPVHFANIAGALDQVPREVRDRVKVVFVGVDPPRDSAERLRSWLDHFDATFIGLTGSDEELRIAQQAAGVPLAQRGPADASGRYGVSHAAWVIGYTPKDEQTWAFPLGVRQVTWAELIEQLVNTGRSDS